MIRIGVDLGGTKIEAIALDQNGTELMRQRVPTPRDEYEDVVKTISRQVELIEQELGQQALVGVGMPGSLSPRTGLVRNANLQIINGKPFDRDLSIAMDKTVRVENDANCFAVSEANDGAAAGEHMVFGVILGTGCGGGVVVDGKSLTGANAIAGEWGHNPLPWRTEEEMNVPQCYCGKYSCNESFISGTGFRADYERHAGHDLSGSQIIQKAQDGDPIAMAAFDRYVDRLARAFAAVINLIDPDVIVCGGGMSNIEAIYENVPAKISPYTFSDGTSTPVRRAKHGDSSGVRGAAWLWSLEELSQAEAEAA